MGLMDIPPKRYRALLRGVFNKETSESIPPNASDPRWQAYQQWVSEGQLPDPYVEPVHVPTAEELAKEAERAERAAMRATLRADNTVDFLRTHTPAEVETWVQTNVTDLATARNVLAKVAMIVAYLARERLRQGN